MLKKFRTIIEAKKPKPQPKEKPTKNKPITLNWSFKKRGGALSAKYYQKMGRGDFDAKEETVVEVAPPGREDQVKELKKKFPGDKAAAFKIAWASYNKRKK